MSRAQKTSRKKSKNFGDITINDFANATVCKNRPKKSNVNRVLKEFEGLSVDDKSWDEKPEEYDGEFVRREAEDGTVSYVLTSGKEKAKKGRVGEDRNGIGRDLPIDIWFVIGKFVKPEDVGRFAGICRSSYSVVCSSKFWVDLYRRYYRNGVALPDDLKPDHLKRKFGVRTLTVRTLFLMYKPFAGRIHRAPHQNVHPKDCLIKRRCVSVWHLKTVKTWSFYFKLEATGSETHCRRYKDADLIEKLDDVFVNPDEGCKILLANSTSFVAIPPVQNYTLCDVNVSLSNDLSQHRLKLKFSSGVYCGSRTTGAANVIELTVSNVINFKVLDWWHPEYPRSSTLEIFLNGD